MSVEWTCVFWRPVESAIWQTSGCRLVPSESNATITTCQCDHLTVFAALMDPYGSHVSTIRRKRRKRVKKRNMETCKYDTSRCLIQCDPKNSFFVSNIFRSPTVFRFCYFLNLESVLLTKEVVILQRETKKAPKQSRKQTNKQRNKHLVHSLNKTCS